MDIEIADKAGYCFGVNNAINKVDKILESENKVYMLGELSHNKQEMNRLEEKGIKKVNSIKDLDSGKVVIRTHGVTRDEINQIQRNN